MILVQQIQCKWPRQSGRWVAQKPSTSKIAEGEFWLSCHLNGDKYILETYWIRVTREGAIGGGEERGGREAEWNLKQGLLNCASTSSNISYCTFLFNIHDKTISLLSNSLIEYRTLQTGFNLECFIHHEYSWFTFAIKQLDYLETTLNISL